jgi:hypothetical protein
MEEYININFEMPEQQNPFKAECDKLARRIVLLSLRSEKTLHETTIMVNASMESFTRELHKAFVDESEVMNLYAALIHERGGDNNRSYGDTSLLVR